MRTFRKWVVVLIIGAASVTTASAQERILPEGTTVKLLLLRQKSVQKELELGDEVTEKIKAFTHKQHEAFHKARELDAAERKQALEKLEKENREFLTGTLTLKQGKRLNQIAMQFTALTHLTKAKTAKALNLTEEQQQKFKALQKEARKKLLDIIDSKDAAGRSEKLAELHESTHASIMAVLTDEQKAQVRKIAGPPFKGRIVLEEPE
jgi:Spy/CpxP family protein refolding chaperone